ncbi:MAG: hypothetical protein ACOC6S_02805 [Chloroflexota bacterium]
MSTQVKQTKLLLAMLVVVLLVVPGNSCVPPPGKSHTEQPQLSGPVPSVIEMEAGETKHAELTLFTRDKGKGLVRYKVSRMKAPPPDEELPMPEGLTLEVTPSSFTAQPDETYHHNLTVKTTPQLSHGVYMLYIIPEFPLTDCPPVHLTLCVGRKALTLTSPRTIDVEAGENEWFDLTVERKIDVGLRCTLSLDRVEQRGSTAKISFPEGMHIRNLDPVTADQSPEKVSVIVRTTADVPAGSYILYVRLEFQDVNIRERWMTVNVK